jgi:hypothetical protein
LKNFFFDEQLVLLIFRSFKIREHRRTKNFKLAMYKKSTGSKVVFQETVQTSPILSRMNNENKALKRSNSTNTKHKSAYTGTRADMQENEQSSNSQGVLYPPSIHAQLNDSIISNHIHSIRHTHLKNHNAQHASSANNASSSNSSRSYLHLFSSLKRSKKKSNKNKAYDSTALNDVDGVRYVENQISKHTQSKQFNRKNTSTSILASPAKSICFSFFI